jgi:Ca2+-binding EF-hand superfamily protein
VHCFPSGTGKVNFDGFCRIAAHFLEEEDSEAMQEELKEAFRLYDREGKIQNKSLIRLSVGKLAT